MGGRKKSGKSQIHATKGGVHIVVLYGIKASSRQYTRILLSGTKTDADFVIGYALYITFEYHLVGNVVGIRIPFVKNHRITLTEIGQTPPYSRLRGVFPPPPYRGGGTGGEA